MGAGTIRAAGGVVWRDGEAGVEVLLVHRPRYDDWSLPKGKADPGESDEDTARREVVEETGLECELGAELPPVDYVDIQGRPKHVRYWVMQVTGEQPWAPNAEVDERAWMRVPVARDALSYDRDITVLDAFEATR